MILGWEIRATSVVHESISSPQLGSHANRTKSWIKQPARRERERTEQGKGGRSAAGSPATSRPALSAEPEPPGRRCGPRPLPVAAVPRAADAERRPGAAGAGRAQARAGQGRGLAEATRGFKYGSRARARGTAFATAAFPESPSTGWLPRGAGPDHLCYSVSCWQKKREPHKYAGAAEGKVE